MKQSLREILFYCLSGGTAVLLHWGWYAFFLWLGLEVHLAYSIGYALGWIANFYLNSSLTFHSKPNAKKAAGFGMAHVFNYLLEMALLEGFLCIGVPAVWAYVPIQIIVVPVTFVLVRFVFRSHWFDGGFNVSVLKGGVLVSFLSNILLAYFVWMLTRVVFVISNWAVFESGWSELSVYEMLCGAIMFDTSAICYANALWVVLLFLPLHYKEVSWWHIMTRTVYVLFNAIGVVANLCDVVYFRYTGRRTTATIFGEFSGEDNLLSVIGIEMVSHCWVLAIGIVLIYLLWRFYVTPHYDGKRILLYYVSRIILLPVIGGLFVAGMRGGFATAVRPITISNAGQYVNRPAEAAIVLNTPFSIIRTWGKTSFPIPDYYASSEELNAIYSPLHEVSLCDTIVTERPNIVILIVESFGREYIGALNSTATGEQLPSYTPFVDSLCSVSLTFDYSFCNGRKSIDGMPSVLSAIPMFVEPFILTSASMNRVGGVASELSAEGYQTAFFHGAQNGSMGFQAFARSTGFEEYFGRTEYNDDPSTNGDEDFDGMWAIWDEPFLQYFARTMTTFKEPFLSSVFTASSHHPYVVPEQYRDTFPDLDDNIMHKCVRYTDHSLRRFFTTASQQPWYHNTIFVITSDHTNLCTYTQYATDLGGFCSPIIFFDPSGRMPRGRRHAIAQHIDIMPTLLDYVGVHRPYIAFGKNLLTTPDSLTWAVNYNNGIYQYVEDSLLLQFDGTSTCGVYNFKTDWMQQHNLLGHPRQQELEQKVKAIIQSYMTRMNADNLCVPKQ